jgi:hypothetical protein
MARVRNLSLLAFFAVVPEPERGEWTNFDHLAEVMPDNSGGVASGLRGANPDVACHSNDTAESTSVICRVAAAEPIPWDSSWGGNPFRYTEFGSTEFAGACVCGATTSGRLAMPVLPPQIPAACGYARTAEWTVQPCESGGRVTVNVYAARAGRFALWVEPEWPYDSEIVCDDPSMLLRLVCEWS